MHHPPSLAETCEQILREQEPNFLRLYLNPHVAQTCFCLDRYVQHDVDGAAGFDPAQATRSPRIASPSSQTALKKRSAAPSNSCATTVTRSGLARPV